MEKRLLLILCNCGLKKLNIKLCITLIRLNNLLKDKKTFSNEKDIFLKTFTYNVEGIYNSATTDHILI